MGRVYKPINQGYFIAEFGCEIKYLGGGRGSGFGARHVAVSKPVRVAIQSFTVIKARNRFRFYARKK